MLFRSRAFSHIIGNMAAPYINTLANRGALFTQSYGITHPSQPNYLAFFSGSTQNVVDNGCPHRFAGPNLASLLIGAGLTFATYSEDLPEAGFAGCRHLHYERKHNPAVNWQGVNVPPSANLPLTDFPRDFSKLPAVSFVVPNQENDMHNGAEPDTIIRGDRWLQERLDAYVKWDPSQTRADIERVWDEYSKMGAYERVPYILAPAVKYVLDHPADAQSAAAMRAYDWHKVIDNRIVDKLVKEKYFEQVFGPGIKAEQDRKSKQAYR